MTEVKRRVAAANKPATAAAASADATGAGGTTQIADGRVRAVIDAVLPAVDGGRFPIKRIAGEAVEIEAQCFTDGHDKLRVVLRWQRTGARDEYEVEMKPHANDVWLAEFTPPRADRYRYTVMAWVDHFESWRRELERRTDPADIRMALQVGSALIDQAAIRAKGSDAAILTEWSAQLSAAIDDANANSDARKVLALDAA